MRIPATNGAAKCPYCGAMEFVPQADSTIPPQEEVCAQCGGYVSHKLLVERAADERKDS